MGDELAKEIGGTALPPMMPVTDKAIPVQVQLDGQTEMQDLADVRVQAWDEADNPTGAPNPTGIKDKQKPTLTNPDGEEPEEMEDTPGDAKWKGDELEGKTKKRSERCKKGI